jgi:hypothetical protein
MKKWTGKRVSTLLLGLGLLLVPFAVGCQSHLGGQTHPSPWYLTDDVQYFAPSSEMKLSREAAVQKEYAAQRELER